MAYILSVKARRDMYHIAVHVAAETNSFATAEKVSASILKRLILIGEHPYIGRTRDNLKKGVRSFPAGHYVIVYRIAGKNARILRVAYGTQDLISLMQS